jgi:hypothetical protein
MHFDVSDRITHPASVVLETLIERTEALVPYLHNVESIEMLERHDLGDGRIRIVRRWQGMPSAVPAALRPMLSRDLFAWIDKAVWTRAAHKVEWTHAPVITHIAKLYDCAGVNYYEPDPASAAVTRARLTGELTIHAAAVPGVPSFVARRLAPEIERFVVGLIKPNLESVAAGLQSYLDGTASART